MLVNDAPETALIPSKRGFPVDEYDAKVNTSPFIADTIAIGIKVLPCAPYESLRDIFEPLCSISKSINPVDPELFVFATDAQVF